MTTCAISVPTIAVIHPDDPEQPLPLSRLDDEYACIHGELRIELGGRVLPNIGYFGADDVCLGEWAEVLRNAVAALRSEDPAVYLFEDYEQGQPAFEFRREGATVFVSIVDNPMGEGDAEPAWQRVPCTLADFERAVAAFLRELRERIEAEAPPEIAKAWWAMVGSRLT